PHDASAAPARLSLSPGPAPARHPTQGTAAPSPRDRSSNLALHPPERRRRGRREHPAARAPAAAGTARRTHRTHHLRAHAPTAERTPPVEQNGAVPSTADAQPTLAAAILQLVRAFFHLVAVASVTVWGFVAWPLPFPGLLTGFGFLALSVLLWALF